MAVAITHDYSGVMTIRFAAYSSLVQGANQRTRTILKHVLISVTVRYKIEIKASIFLA